MEALLAAEKKSLVYNPMNTFDSLKRIFFYLFLAIFLFQRIAGFVLVFVQRIDNIGRDIDGGEYPRDGLFLFWKIIKCDKMLPLNYIRSNFLTNINWLRLKSI